MIRQRVLRVNIEELLKPLPGRTAITQVVTVNFALGDKGGKTIAAERVLQAQEFVLADGVVQELFVGEETAFFAEKLGHDQDAGVSPGGCGVVVVDGAVGVQHPLVGQDGPVGFGTSLESGSQPLSTLKRRQAGELPCGRGGVSGKGGEENSKYGERPPGRRHAALRAERTERTRGTEHSC